MSSAVTAIVIARGGSSRLPNKNMLDFHGMPLVAHKVAMLRGCRLIDQVIVGSDSDDILNAAREAGADTRRRAPEFCDEKSRTWNEVIKDMVSKVSGDVIVWAHCTNPCIQIRTIERAIAKYFSMPDSFDSLVSVSPLRSHVWWRGKPLNFDPWGSAHQVAANLEPIFYQNGALFIHSRAGMAFDSYVYGRNPFLYEIDPDEAVDIDTHADYERALALWPKVRANVG